MNWIIENWPAIIGTIGAFMTAFQLLTELTPTPSDDKLIGKVYKLFELFAGKWNKSRQSNRMVK